MVRFDPTVPVDGAEHAILALAAREQDGCVPCSDRASSPDGATASANVALVAEILRPADFSFH